MGRHVQPRNGGFATKRQPREPRRAVWVSALLRGSGRERMVRIRNASSRGLLIEADEAPEVGLVVEVCTGRSSVIGRIVWRKDKQFGFHSRSIIAERFLLDGARPGQEFRRTRLAGRLSSQARTNRDYRHLSRSLQFLVGVALAFAGCAAIGLLLYEMLLVPMQAVSDHLSPGTEQR